ncbi:uncharacterized protein LOC106873363 [Octopus bimaculoides]|uniref:THD domain-containing protein n=1 Tax=Octopus bimaculoides TaxID=37653 RepID=A0A0L8H1L3_OCTBM|nr:uncharacterized protein LOC106873363 [Octopus bimaculoides]|eukprot:XP_014776179.1 PREDICTED: uncharacterized protein LOC106873363 [Octopus bimaculoides]
MTRPANEEEKKVDSVEVVYQKKITEIEKEPLTRTVIVERRPRLCFKCVSFALIIIAVVIAVTGLIQVNILQQPEPSPRPQSHHAFFQLKTEGYTELERVTNLHWEKSRQQNVGNIQLVDDTYIYIPQDGIYEINCAVQLYIPKDTSSMVVTLMFQKKNGTKYEYMKESSNSLEDLPEHVVIQSGFTYRLKTNDTIFLKMNMAKYISPNKPSSYLSITSLHENLHQ